MRTIPQRTFRPAPPLVGLALLALVVLACGEHSPVEAGPQAAEAPSYALSGDAVADRIAGMQAKVDDYEAEGRIDNRGIANGLRKLLSNTADAVARDERAAGEKMMVAFRNRLSAQRGKHIEAAAADELDADAAEVIDLITGEATPAEADLSLTLTVESDPEGDAFTHHVTVANAGPDAVTDVQVELIVIEDAGTLDAGDIVSEPQECTGTAAEDGSSLTFQCTIASLEAGTAETLVVAVEGEALESQADVTGFEGAEDPNPDDNIAVGNHVPAVLIELPWSGSLFEPGEAVPFSGSATDPEDGALDGAALVWTSSIDGEIGTGATFSRSDLSNGLHTIRLTATDGGGASASASVGITIEDPAPSEGTALAWERILGPVPALPDIPLHDVHAISATDVYVVGSACSSGRRTIQHWDGTSWTPQPLEHACPVGVWASASDDVYAVGLGGRIRHFDGTAWTDHSTATTATLRDAWGATPDDVWAVGEGVLLHYDGNPDGVWTTEMTSADIDGTLRLWSVWGSSATDVYAAGPSGNLWHYDGTGWSPVVTGFNIGNVTAVWGSGADDVFVVGQFASIFHWDGASWTRHDPPAEVTNEFLFRVWGSGPADVYAVGVNGTIIRYDGAAWTRLQGGGPHLRAVGGADGAVFAVGDRSLILEQDAGGWKVRSTGQTLQSVWAAGPTDVFAAVGSHGVGVGGMVLRYDGVDWTVQKTDLTGHDLGSGFAGVWGTSASDVWAVGTSGTILHFDGAAWTRQESGTRATLTSVWGTAGDHVFAVGSSGTILHYDGVSWTAQESGTTVQLWDVGGAAADHVWAVGSSGTILHYDGADWSPQPSGTTGTLRGVWAAAPNRAFVVSQSGGDAFHYDGAEWKPHHFAYHFGFEVWGASTTDVFAAASSDDVMHWDGTSWSAQDTPARLPCCSNTLFGIHGVSATEVFAVGGSGFAVRSVP